MTATERYQKAHEENFKQQYPSAYNDGHYAPPKMPKIKTANGLTKFITNFLLWKGHRATRVNVSGRMIDDIEVGPTGNKIGVKKWIPSSTRKGASDISATIFGKSVMLEIKCGSDKPRLEQIREQALERKAGGVYEFISTTEQFFILYDSLVSM